jgi:hypothetical protein
LPIGLNDVRIDIYPLDLTKHSITDDLKGQLVVAEILFSPELKRLLDIVNSDIISGIHLIFEIAFGNRALNLSVRLIFDRGVDSPSADLSSLSAEESDKLKHWLDRLEDDGKVSSNRMLYETHFDVLELSGVLPDDILPRLEEQDFFIAHNGITVPTDLPGGGRRAESITAAADSSMQAVIGAILLQDRLRPDLSLSRDYVRDLSLEILATGDLVKNRARQSILNSTGESQYSRLFEVPFSFENKSLDQILRDPLLQPYGPWWNEPIFQVQIEDGVVSILSLDEILRFLSDYKLMQLHSPVLPSYALTAWQVYAAALSIRYLELRMKTHESGRHEIIITSRRKDSPLAGELLFAPATFLRFTNTDSLRGRSAVLNREHPFSRWLIETSPELAMRYPGILEEVRTNILTDYSYAGSTWTGHGMEEDLLQVNETLTRLSLLNERLAPPSEAIPRLSDVGNF